MRDASPGAAWATRLASKNQAAAALTQARRAGAWPALPRAPLPESVATERAAFGPAQGAESAASPSLLLAGWEHAGHAAAKRGPQTSSPWPGHAARAACVVGLGLGAAGLATGLLPLVGLGVGVWALSAVVAVVIRLRQRRPAATLPSFGAAEDLGGRHSMLRAAGAAALELEVLQSHARAAGTPDMPALRRIIHDASAVKAQHLLQERAALHLPRRNAQGTADRARVADACLEPWTQVECGLLMDAGQQSSLSDAAMLRLVWVFLSSRDALDACLGGLPACPALGWETRDGVTRVRLADWQAALRRHDAQAQTQLSRFCASAREFALQDYPKRLSARIDALQEHWASREQLKSQSKVPSHL